MAVDTDMILTVGRFIPDAGAPEGRTVRMEDYLAALSRELETLYIRMNDLLRDLDGRTAALESAARSAAYPASARRGFCRFFHAAYRRSGAFFSSPFSWRA